MSEAFRVLSWGCGVQSTTLAAMSALGEIERLDAILTADTGWERRRTYEVRDWYVGWLRERDLRVEIVQGGDVRKQGAEEHIHIPFWTSDGGPLQRQCTYEFRIRPIRHRVRELLGFHPSRPPAPSAGAVELWLGISLDEYVRMRRSDVQFVVHRWPLVERRITREECVDWLQAHGLPVPVKSACVGCPYRSASEYLEMREHDPAEFDDAVVFDEANRHNPLAVRGASTADELFIWQGVVPLATADLEAAAARERQKRVQLPLFCESGYCHV